VRSTSCSGSRSARPTTSPSPFACANWSRAFARCCVGRITNTDEEIVTLRRPAHRLRSTHGHPAGEEIELSRKEFDLLALFASRLSQVVTREVCLDTLWWGLELSDTRTLDTHVKRLRQKIENDPANPRHLITIRGVGFRLDP
jgi:DNA-binding response OmpR family regulator